MTPDTNNSPAPLISCPSCKANIKWTAENPHRPFCSESCKNRDFIAWADEDRNMPGNADYDGVLSESLGND